VVATGAWTRAGDADTSAEVSSGMFTFVSEGTTNADSGWVLATNDPITLGTTGLSFTQFSGAGTVVAGAGLTKTGSTLDVVAADGSLTVNADSITVGNVPIGKGGTGATTAVGARTALGAVGKYDVDLGALTAGSEATITHGLNTTEVVVNFRRTSDGYAEFLDWRVIDANSIGVTSGVAYSASALHVVVMG
jgi:phage-related tail fiber protein